MVISISLTMTCQSGGVVEDGHIFRGHEDVREDIRE